MNNLFKHKQHPNDCNHKDNEFYGHVNLGNHGYGDLYFFYSKSFEGWEYCFRTGEGGEYSSMPMKYVLRWNGYSDDAKKIIEYFVDFMDRKYLTNHS